VPRHENIRFHFYGTVNGRIEIVDLKPQQNAIAIRLVGRIADPTMMMFHIKSMQLEDQNAVRNQSLVFRPSVCAPAAQEPLIPAATCLDVTDCNKGLGTHGAFIASSCHEAKVTGSGKVARLERIPGGGGLSDDLR
jgi:hypothetical protein